MFRTGALFCARTLISICQRPCIENAIKHRCLAAVKLQSVRNTSFFNRLSQEELWKGTTSVSNAGRRKGRARAGDRKTRRNLNFGKKLGDGKMRVQFPGLNVGVFSKGSKNKLNEVKKLPEIEAENKETNAPVKKSKKIHPLDRGWSGGSVKGRKLGPPEPNEDHTFENFQSIVLEAKIAIVQTALVGKKKRFFTVMGIGNGAGVIGFGTAKTNHHRISVRLAKSRATRRLLTVDLIENHTVNHDFFSEYATTKVFAFKRPRGYGLVCHRIIKAICQLVGIEDLYAKVEGAKNPLQIIRAFVTGLLRQKTYQEIANEKKLHLVEYREECLNFPRVLASPEECLPLEEVRKQPVLFEEYIMGGKLPYKRDPVVPFYEKLPSWNVYLKRTACRRNHQKVKFDLMLKYGSVKSFLSRVYPECHSPGYQPAAKKTAN